MSHLIAGTNTTVTNGSNQCSGAGDAAVDVVASPTFSGPVTGNAYGGGPQSALIASAGYAAIALQETGAATDNKWWDIAAGGSLLTIRAVNDANTVAGAAIAISRNATTVTSIALSGAVTCASSLTINGALKPSRQTFSNAAVTCNSTTTMLAQIGTMSVSRTVTLPAASTFGTGVLIIVDESGSAAATKKITVARSASDTINGSTVKDAVIAAYGMAMLYCDGASKWTLNRLTPV